MLIFQLSISVKLRLKKEGKIDRKKDRSFRKSIYFLINMQSAILETLRCKEHSNSMICEENTHSYILSIITPTPTHPPTHTHLISLSQTYKEGPFKQYVTLF